MRRCIVVLSLAIVSLGSGCSCNDNPARPDAGTPPDGAQPTEVVCATLPPIASGATCEVSGTGATKLLKGVVLTPATIFRGGQVAVDAAGSITCVGCDCAAGGETVISCPDGAISPGLINTHDHITFTQNQPYTNTGERYEHRHQWRKGQDGHSSIPSAGGASGDQIRWGELRFLMGGATSIVGSGGQAGLLRNLDSAPTASATSSNQEGLSQGKVDFDTFPLDDSGGTRHTSGCAYGANATTAANIANDDAYEPHTAEGIDSSARNEFLCESTSDGGGNNLLLGKTAMIHAIGLQPADLAAMAQAGTGLIWSPRSNITLYGDTARVTTAQRLGVEIALGTDWMPTGSMNLLRELKCADSLNTNYYHYFTDVQLWQMVTTNAAAVTATDDVIGLLAPGKVADIAIFAAHGKSFRAVIDAEPQDVALVMRGGKTLYGDDAAVTALAQTCDAVDVCGTGKRVCLMGEVGKTYAALQTAAGSSYPAFQCGSPPNEPSCTPSRPMSVNGSTVYTGVPSATDDDGDGIPNATDKCPTVFDPIRPVDNSVQGDADGDGVGDACDPCPFDANTSNCSSVDPNDRDNDGVANAVDNCPDVANPDQADADADAKGDVCDACPDDSNPGAAGCSASIYNIKMGTTPVGTTVRVVNALVTGRGTNGFFVQVKEGDAGYLGADFSGLFVFAGAASPSLANATVGARVTIDGRVANFQNQIELDSVTAVTVTAVGPEAPPAPIAATYAEVKTGGTRATALESVIVALGASTVSAADATAGEFTLTAGADSLVSDDFLFVTTPAPGIGQSFVAAKGILALRQMVSKLEPRLAADLTLGAPGLASFGPALSFARVGVTTAAPTFPTALTVTLTGPAQGDTTVTIVSGNSNKLAVVNVVVPNGQTSQTVAATALIADTTPINVTAQLGLQMQQAQVRVLGTVETPTTVTLSPPAASVAVAGTVEFTVTLDVPALNATQVALAVIPGNGGSVPAQVTVNPNQIAASFTYTNAAPSGTVMVSATFNANTSNATVTVSTGANHLVINEVDYDQPASPDSAEFIEIHNPTGAPISLAGLQVLLVNGNGNTVYATIDLAPAGTIPSKGYLVIAGANVTVSAPALKLDPGFTTDEIQNGAPDGIALINNTTHTLIDALSYEGSITAADLTGFAAPVPLVEGTATTAADVTPFTGSVCRFPDGQDTDNALADWKVCTTLSPGTANP